MSLKNTLLFRDYKNHTVSNPVDDLNHENLPDNAMAVHNQPVRKMTVTIQVLDETDGTVIETITGKAEDGRIQVDSTSLVRRTGAITLEVDDDLFPQPGSLMWFNRYLKVYVGIDDNSKTNHTVNFLAGTFWIDEGTYTLNQDKSQLEFKLKDKMSKWDNKQLENPLRIEIDTPINVAMQIMMESFGETEFGEIVEGRAGEVVPYTMEFNIGDDCVSVIRQLRDMYMDYHCGYNVRGEFEFVRIESQREEDLDEPKWRFDTEDTTLRTMIDFNETYSLGSIRNRVTVYGGTSTVTGITPSSEARITDARSPFNVYSIGEKTEVVIESKYVTDEQCAALARYTVWERSNFQEVCNIRTVPIYLLDVNDVIDVRHPRTGIEHKYIVEDISYGLTTDSAMDIKARKVYYVTLEYGRDKDPIVEAIVRGIGNYGWISLGEERIAQCYNIVGSGRNTITVRFQENIEGGEQMAIVSYSSTKNQSLIIDLADMVDLDKDSALGGYIQGSNRSVGDSLNLILPHEMVHAVHNDFYGHSNMIEVPIWFKEGFAEAIAAPRFRFDSVYQHLGQTGKRQELTSLSESLLNNNFNGTSEDYVASYVIAIAIYRIAQRYGMWSNLFVNLRNQVNLSINFLLKLLPIAPTNEEVKAMVINEIKAMDSVWDFWFDANDPDVGSIAGIHFMNLYGIPLTVDNIYNSANATVDSIGFKLEFIK